MSQKKSLQEVKASREMGARYMTFQELLKDERAEGKAEGKAENVLELLQEVGVVPEELQKRIMSERDLNVLTEWNKLAAKSNSIEEFVGKI